jgi:very-short-patch-repair endonuclease
MASFLEQVLSQDLTRCGIEHEREFKPFEDRKWRCDFRIVGTKVLVEVEGGAGFGRHSRREGFLKDAEKYARCAREGWVVLRFTSPQVQGALEPGMDSEAVETIRAAITYFGEESA